MPDRALDAQDRVVGTHGVPASMPFHPVEDSPISQAWGDWSDGRGARDSGPVWCQGLRNLCGVEDNGRDGLGLRGLGGTDLSPTLALRPCPECWSCSPIDMKKARI